MLTFSRKYLFFTLLLFVIEVCIAIFFNDSFIRPFIGDVLVVILIYCFFKTFLQIKSSILALSVFLFACTVEILQYFNFINYLGWQKNQVAAVILGSTFDWKDIIAYAIGCLTVFWLENKK
ncbi:ribosomal maturation YjgA family protein [Calothrix sp. 336/3]|uniref:ribosomal maturation YjgA family protein n=1 Tax=Calothrix sp. 336/3 TaxID=1337936 RepID=UPI0004E317F1|nr:DUF2809 domain-containing protein [Calothrix sp. 336/3]AKG22067.1 hypothetical protein IJ00_13100 [Calothrix sp. 336/3]